MRAVALHASCWVLAAFACALAAAPMTAQAQDAAGDAYASAPPLAAADPNADAPVTPEEVEAVARALLFDPAGLAQAAPNKPLKLPGTLVPKDLDVSGNGKPDGSSSVVVKKPLATEWDATLGADLNPAGTAPETYLPRQPATPESRGSGAAWASVGVSRFASVDARVDPGNEQGKLGATLKHSIGDKYSVTLQNVYSVSESSGPAPTLSGLPLTTTPAATAAPGTVWGDEKNVKFNIAPTGTTLGAGLSSSSIDPITHNTLSADQKLYGPLHVTTAVTDVGQTVSNKSISAGLKLKW